MPGKLPEQPEAMQPVLIARCGINCGLCLAYLRVKERCMGCNSASAFKAHHCEVCSLKNCPEGGTQEPKFCFDCDHFPCARLRQLDKRYRVRYGLSVIANLETIRDAGMEAFLAQEEQRWRCPQCGQVTCMHRPACLFCGFQREIQPLPPRAREKRSKI